MAAKHVFVTCSLLMVVAVLGEELRTNPTLDYVNLEQYFRNDRYLNLQKRCLFEDGPCDLIGRWFKPRLSSALMGNCEMCTENQTVMVTNLMDFLKSEKPEVYEMAVRTFLNDDQLVTLVKSTNGISSNTEAAFNEDQDQTIDDNEPATAESINVQQTRSLTLDNRAALPYPYVQSVNWVDFNLLTTPKSDKTFRIPIIPDK